MPEINVAQNLSIEVTQLFTYHSKAESTLH